MLVGFAESIEAYYYVCILIRIFYQSSKHQKQETFGEVQVSIYRWVENHRRRADRRRN